MEIEKIMSEILSGCCDKKKILLPSMKKKEIVQDERVINTQQQLTIDRQNTVIQNLESEIDKLNGKVKENSSGMIFHSLLSLWYSIATLLTRDVKSRFFL
jgi:hypothetical protein